jgi:hypothetical protein
MLTAQSANQTATWARLAYDNKDKYDFDTVFARILAKIQMAASLGEMHVSYYQYGGPVDGSGEDYHDLGEFIPVRHQNRVFIDLIELGFAVCDSNIEHEIIIGWDGSTNDELYAEYGNK